MSYDENNIRYLPPKDHILQRPEMYIGRELNEDGVYFIIEHILKTAADKENLNAASTIQVTINPDNSLSIYDDGRGLPTRQGKVDPIERLLTGYVEWHPTHDYYEAFGYLDYMITVLCAISSRLIIETHWEGTSRKVVAARCEIIEPVTPINDLTEKGTRITFTPHKAILGENTFSQVRIKVILSRLSSNYPEKHFILV